MLTDWWIQSPSTKLKMLLFQFCLFFLFFFWLQHQCYFSSILGILRSLQALSLWSYVLSEKCITDAKNKSETWKWTCLKNTIRTCKVFLRKDRLMATVSKKEQLLQERLDWDQDYQVKKKKKKFDMVNTKGNKMKRGIF